MTEVVSVFRQYTKKSMDRRRFISGIKEFVPIYFMKRICLIITILFPFQSIAQETNDSFQYYANGDIKSVTRKFDDNVSEYS